MTEMISPSHSSSADSGKISVGSRLPAGDVGSKSPMAAKVNNPTLWVFCLMKGATVALFLGSES